MDPTILGIHHVTAITSDAQQNVDFYTGVLGLRLVKVTVNFDDPGSYHLYYGDELGRPGSAMTFFAWPGGGRGIHGTGQVTATSFSVPPGAIGFWRDRLRQHGVTIAQSSIRFNEEYLPFYDPDGLLLEIVADSLADNRAPWLGADIPDTAAIRGFHSAAVSEEGFEQTAVLLRETMAFQQVGQHENRYRFAAGDGGPGAYVDVLCRPDAAQGIVSVGTVHHIAWRTGTDEQQATWRGKISDLGYNVSPIMDREYFHSIYYREPGGVLFEIATDGPGFTADEAPESLGTTLQLPPWLERARPIIEERIPRLVLKNGVTIPNER